MTTSLLPLGLVVVFGSALTLRLWLGHGGKSEAQPAAVSRSEANRDIERRLDRAVNGPSPGCGVARKDPDRLSPSDAPPYIPRPQVCSSPERWRETP
jgi:hypothetical protein